MISDFPVLQIFPKQVHFSSILYTRLPIPIQSYNFRPYWAMDLFQHKFPPAALNNQTILRLHLRLVYRSAFSPFILLLLIRVTNEFYNHNFASRRMEEYGAILYAFSIGTPSRTKSSGDLRLVSTCKYPEFKLK